MADNATYRQNATEAAMKVLKRSKNPLTRAEINEKVGDVPGASDKAHKVAGEVNDAEYAGRIVDGYFFTRPGRGVYHAQKAPKDATQEQVAELAAQIRANSKKVSEEDASQNGASESDGNQA